MKKILMEILCLAMVFLSFGNAIPALGAEYQADLSEQEINTFEDHFKDVEVSLNYTPTVDKYVKTAKSLIANKQVTLQTTESNLDFENAKIVKMEAEGITAISIPYKASNDYNIISGVAIAFDSNEKMTGYVEQQALNNNGNFAFKFYQDGKYISSEESNISYVSNEETRKTLDSFREYRISSLDRGLDLKCFAAITGATGAVIAAIVKLCGAPCVLTGAACIACLVAISVVGAGGVAGAVWACWK